MGDDREIYLDDKERPSKALHVGEDLANLVYLLGACSSLHILRGFPLSHLDRDEIGQKDQHPSHEKIDQEAGTKPETLSNP